jgi:hypothetical protein
LQFPAFESAALQPVLKAVKPVILPNGITRNLFLGLSFYEKQIPHPTKTAAIQDDRVGGRSLNWTIERPS